MPSTTSLFRIDRFTVPAAARPAFMARLRHIDALLAAQPGCVRHLVLQQAGDADTSGAMRVATLVEWAGQEAMERARAAVQARYASEGFDPPAFMRQLGVHAELGTYTPATD